VHSKFHTPSSALTTLNPTFAPQIINDLKKETPKKWKETKIVKAFKLFVEGK
jgi:hypothetical protein